MKIDLLARLLNRVNIQHFNRYLKFRITKGSASLILRPFSYIEISFLVNGWNSPWELGTRNYIMKRITETDFFLDIGSNTGTYALFAAAVRPQLKVIAFEPLPENVNAIDEVISLNQLDNVSIVGAALSDQSGFSSFSVPLNGQYPCSGSLATQLYSTDKPMRKINFLALQLDEFEKMIPPLSRVGLKIDVEGHELQVLRGGEHFIKTHKPWIVCEFLPTSCDHFVEIVSLLSPLGYAPYRMGESGDQIAFLEFSEIQFDRFGYENILFNI